MSELTTDTIRPKADLLNRPLAAAMTLDWEKAIYFAFIVLALVSRFYDLGSRVVSHDESLHTQYSYQFYNGEGFSHTPLMHGPFLFHITAASFWLFGHSDFTSRIPVALFGVLLVVLPYFLRDWLGKKGALFASFFFLISPYTLYYSRYIRHDIYAIVCGVVLFISILYYLRDPQEKYLWWFAGSLGLLFTTKEVSFIYVAIFGSFLVIRLLAYLAVAKSFRNQWRRLIPTTAILGVALLLFVGGIGWSSILSGEGEVSAETETADEPVAADPDTATETAIDTVASEGTQTIARILTLLGAIGVGVALFLMVRTVRPYLQAYPEYDLIMLFSTLLLPLMAAMLAIMGGINPRDFTMRQCTLITSGGELSPASEFIRKLATPECWNAWVSSPLVITYLIMFMLFGASIAVGLWWGGRRWAIAAIIFHIIFTIFYTSFFTNSGGWYSGYVDSLAYWWEQQEVERGNQPSYYYAIVVPIYEFLPLIFSLLAIRIWLIRRELGVIGSAVFALLSGVLAYSFVNWLFNREFAGDGIGVGAILLTVVLIGVWGAVRFGRNRLSQGWTPILSTILGISAVIALLATMAQSTISGLVTDEAGLEVLRETPTRLPGFLVAFLVLALTIVYWAMFVRPTAKSEFSWRERLNVTELFGFIPFTIWWLLLTWAAYSYAGEKMPWLSTHFVIPMALLAGWYFQQKLRKVLWRDFSSTQSLSLIGLAAVTLLVGFIGAKTFLVDIEWGNQELGNLTNVGVFFGRIATLIAVIALFTYVARNAEQRVVRRAWLFGGFILLSFFTIRAAYLASFPNADYTNEYLVYAHGAPATKAQVLDQLEEISMRLHGDKSIDVRFDNDSSWPMYWYLRDYPNNRYFGENPGADITDAPVLIVGNDNWGKVDAIVRDEYEYDTYTYLWWPMEEYRNINWNAVFGINNLGEEAQRGLGSRAVREALWDIAFFRNFDSYGDVFNINYDRGQWPLRDELRIYIRKDALAKVWDSGIAGTAYVPPVDPYAEGELELSAIQQFGGEGILSRPRNVAVGNDGRVYVADSGNHRIVVFNPDGSQAFTFGSFGNIPEATALQFNEPWGIAVDENSLYVADTWNYRIQKFTLDGEFVTLFGTGGSPEGDAAGELMFFGPRDIAVGADGSLLITDTGNHRVQKTDLNGAFLGQVGKEGFQLGEFNEPTSLTVGQDGTIYVAEAWTERIQQLTGDLFPVTEWEVDAWDGNSLDNKPYLVIDSGGRIFATDPEGYRVLIFNEIGEYLGRFGRFGTDLNSFDLPTGIAVDTENNIYIADTNNNRILKFAPIDFNTIIEVAPAESEGREQSEP